MALAIRNHNKRQLLSLKPFLKQHPLSPGSNLVLIHHSMDKVFRGSCVLRDKNALSRAQTICLYYHRPRHLRKRPNSISRIFKCAIHFRGRNMVALQKLLGKDLAPLQLRGLLGRSHNRPAALAKRVSDSVHQGQFWPDNSEVRTKPFGQRHQFRHVRGIGRQALRFGFDPAVSGHAPNLVHARTLLQLPHQGVFPPASANDQNLHQYSSLRNPSER